MKWLDPLFWNGTHRQKEIPEGVDETHLTLYLGPNFLQNISKVYWNNFILKLTTI